MIETFGPSSPDGLLLASTFCLTIAAISQPTTSLWGRAQLLILVQILRIWCIHNDPNVIQSLPEFVRYPSFVYPLSISPMMKAFPTFAVSTLAPVSVITQTDCGESLSA